MFSLAHSARLERNSRVRLRRWLILLSLFALLQSAEPAFPFDFSYWVWQREEPLSEEEATLLAAQDVHTIYWHIGELENTSESWRWKARFPLPTGNRSLHIIPVVRLVSREPQPFSPASLAALIAALASAGKLTGELQLDYDAPDRLLDDYGRALAQIRKTTSRLSITALPHWSRADCLRPLANNVDELFPMLYDFEAEPVLRNGQPQPIIDPEKMARMLRDWSACAKPWHAGLPSFARLTIYNAEGKSRGQIRNWNWDEVCLSRDLLLASPSQLGTTLWRARAPCVISNTRLQTNDQLAVRLADRDALRSAIEAVRKTTATGVTFFRLPDSAASSGWSVSQLSHLGDAQAQLTFRASASGDSCILENETPADLEPCLHSGDGEERGYAVELAADLPVFREAEPGDFAGVTSSANGKHVTIPFATRVAFVFSQLRARQTLKTGLIQLAPGTDLGHARYRFRNLKGDSRWRPLN
ncbi:MAG TPA: DUF3142 domain-containing protein [Chthoniobacterales bacterium]